MSRSPDDIERDIEATRASLIQTVATIERRLTPGRLIDDLISGALDGRERRDFVELARRHPIPVTLVGIGLAWLLLSGRRRRPVPAPPPPPPPPRDEWVERPRPEMPAPMAPVPPPPPPPPPPR
ncbi:MAG: DUF3618 domain-containing protein [Alphaproteobacteria bacterium]